MRYALLATLMIVLAVASAGAQNLPAIRQIGRLERVTTDSLASAAVALPMAGGRVLVSDRLSRRLLLFDSTLAHATVVADTTSATANAYGRGIGSLIRYRGDSALFIDLESLSMFVLAPTGAIARVMAIPRPDDASGLLGGPLGTPSVDGRGRLAYYTGQRPGGVEIIARGSRISVPGKIPSEIPSYIDSAFVARVDLATRAVDTAVSVRIPKIAKTVKLDPQGFLLSMETTPDPLSVVDGWAMLADGTIAVVRGRDYHVEWIAPDGKVTSSPKLAFDWQHLSDDRKQVVIDSAVAALQATFDRAAARAGGGGGRGSGGRGGSGSGSPDGARSGELLPNLVKRPRLGDLPDYFPAFDLGAVRADADGNLWIRTTTMVGGQPVYDIVNRRGELIDRVQLPSFRTIAGFGPGVVYMAVKDAAGIVRLERARVK